MDSGHVIRLSIYISLMVAASLAAVVAIRRNRRVIRCQQRRIDEQDEQIDTQHDKLDELRGELHSLHCKVRVLMHPTAVPTIAPVVPLAAYMARHGEAGEVTTEAVPLQPE